MILFTQPQVNGLPTIKQVYLSDYFSKLCWLFSLRSPIANTINNKHDLYLYLHTDNRKERQQIKAITLNKKKGFYVTLSENRLQLFPEYESDSTDYWRSALNYDAVSISFLYIFGIGRKFIITEYLYHLYLLG